MHPVVGLLFFCLDTVIVGMSCRSGAFSSPHDELGQETSDQQEDMEFDVRYGLMETGDYEYKKE